MAEQKWQYVRMTEDYEIEHAPTNDPDGKITGHIVMNVKAWFDENPEERKRLGWIKHITHDYKEVEYNRQSQYVVQTTRAIDEYTIEDVLHVLDKSEEMMRLEELLQMSDVYSGNGFVFTGGDWL